MTLAGNRLSLGDACERCADEFLRDLKEHDVQAKEALVKSEENKETTTWKLRWRPWHKKALLIWKKPISRRYCWPTKNRDGYGRATGEPRLQARDRAHQWRETLPS